MGAGALVDLADKNGFTPLMAAAMHGNLEIFRELLARSTNLHAETRCKDGSDLLGTGARWRQSGNRQSLLWNVCLQCLNGEAAPGALFKEP